MGQHFLLSKDARDLPLKKVMRMTEPGAYRLFKRARWPETNGEPYCPDCGNLRCYELARGQRFKCSAKECRKEFTVTSGTIFASRKLKFGEILIVIAMSANGAKGKAALQVARELGVQTKTAWLNLMKLREALAARRGQMLLDGQVEIDGMYLAGHIRRENRKEDREDHRKIQSPQRAVVMAVRERHSSGQTLTRVTPSENSDCAWDMVRSHVSRKAHVYADEHLAYDELCGLNTLTRVNHSEAYQHGFRGLDEHHREFLLPYPPRIPRRPSPLLAEIHGLVRRRDGLARGSSSTGQSRADHRDARARSGASDVPQSVWVLARKQAE